MSVHQLLQCNLNLLPLGLLCRRTTSCVMQYSFPQFNCVPYKFKATNFAKIFCKLSNTASNILKPTGCAGRKTWPEFQKKSKILLKEGGKVAKVKKDKLINIGRESPIFYSFGKDAKIHGWGRDRLKVIRQQLFLTPLSSKGRFMWFCKAEVWSSLGIFWVM